MMRNKGNGRRLAWWGIVLVMVGALVRHCSSEAPVNQDKPLIDDPRCPYGPNCPTATTPDAG